MRSFADSTYKACGKCPVLLLCSASKIESPLFNFFQLAYDGITPESSFLLVYANISSLNDLFNQVIEAGFRPFGKANHTVHYMGGYCYGNKIDPCEEVKPSTVIRVDSVPSFSSDFVECHFSSQRPPFLYAVTTDERREYTVKRICGLIGAFKNDAAVEIELSGDNSLWTEDIPLLDILYGNEVNIVIFDE